VVRYSFIVEDSHPLLLAGLPAHWHKTQIDLYHLVQMADLLDVSIDWLLDREDTPEI
jgi:hypothetical protein